MASIEDLKDAIKETLDNRGVVDQLRARIRAEIFNALEDKESPKPQLTNENLIINELIREYLEFNQYKHTLSVFLPETGQPKDPLQRKFLAKETNMMDNPTTLSVPLLYSILAKLQEPPPVQPLPSDYSREYEPENFNYRNNNNVNSSTKAPPKATKTQSHHQYQQPHQHSQPQQSFASEASHLRHPATQYTHEDDLQPLVFTHK